MMAVSIYVSLNRHIYLAIRRGFSLSRKTSNTILWNFAIIRVSYFQNNLKDLDPSYKMDLVFGFFWKVKKLCLVTEEIRYHPTASL